MTFKRDISHALEGKPVFDGDGQAGRALLMSGPDDTAESAAALLGDAGQWGLFPAAGAVVARVESEYSKTIQQFPEASQSLSPGQCSDSSMWTQNNLRQVCLFVVLLLTVR